MEDNQSLPLEDKVIFGLKQLVSDILKSDLIQQMNPRKRRQCCVMGQCLLFMALQHSNDRIITNYRQNSANTVQEGIKMFENITAQFLKNKYGQQQVPPTFGMGSQFENKKDFMISAKKELVVSQPSEISHTEQKKWYSFDKSQQKNAQFFQLPQASKKKKMTQVEEMQESLKKMGLEDNSDQFWNVAENEQKHEKINLEYLNSKSVMELIQESNRKIEEKSQERQAQRSLPKDDASSGSSYPITDYSSNESSNDNDYEEYLASEKSESKTEVYKTVSNLPSFSSHSQSTNFQAKKLMFSPKKSKSNAKRLYVRDKKIPRWAQDLSSINEMVKLQKKDPKFDAAEIYGICLVEKLDTNVIFNDNDFYQRGSSARWNHHPYSQFQ